MKIDGSNPFIDSKLHVGQTENSAQEQSKKVQELNQVGDRLEFSASSRQLETYQQKVREAPEVRSERVHAISEKLKAGTYDIKADVVAESMIKGGIVDEQA